MGKILSILIIGGGLVAATFFALDAHETQVTELEYQVQLSKLRNQYVERSGWVRSIPDQERWRDEFISLNRWYETQWTALHNRFPGRGSTDGVLAEIEERAAAGAQDTALRMEFFEHTKGFQKVLASGHYLPIATHIASGVRLDLLDMKKVVHDGRKALRVDLAAWGAPRQMLEGRSQGEVTQKLALDFALNSFSVEFIDENDKLIGGGDTGGPEILIDYPERWVPAFPPQAAFAIWWIEPMPSETKTVLLTIDGNIRSSAAGSMPVTMEWRLPASEGWKLGEGVEFEGDERVMPEEAMDRRGQ